MATVKPGQLSAENAAKGLRSAMKGIGTDEDAIIKIVANHTNKQRQEIKAVYKTMFGRELDHDLKSEIDGKFLQCVESAMATPAVYDARELQKAMKGAGTKESVLIEILASRDDAHLAAIKVAYKQEFGSDLEEALMSETGGDFGHLVVALANSQRNEQEGVNEAKAREDAQRLFDAGEKKWGTDESVFNQILCLRSFSQLRATFKAYASIAGHDIEQAIDSEVGGDTKDGYLAIVKCVRSLVDYFIELLYDAMKGAGTNDDRMIRIIITRSEIDLADIKKAFRAKYEQELREFVEGECGGDYAKFLVDIIG